MKKVILFLLIAIIILISCTACAKNDRNNIESQTEAQTEKIHTVNIYISQIHADGLTRVTKTKTMEVKDGDIIGKISTDFLRGELKGFFTTKTAIQGQEWNPVKDEVHSDLDIYIVVQH